MPNNVNGSPGDARSEPTQAWIDELRTTRFDVRTKLQSCEWTRAEVFDQARQRPVRDGRESHSPLWPVKLLWALESLPNARKVDTRRKLAELGESETQPIGTLTDAQRSLILQTFPLSNAQ